MQVDFSSSEKSLFDVKQLNIEALSHIRKESLDIYNRLHSIAKDVSFIHQVHEQYPGIPLLPNLRCGAWYTDPTISNSMPAYFKSTDGHFSNWSFNLRRANLHLLPLVIEHCGMILVDSTRAGKRIPDSLSKTIPIWCTVINHTMLLLHPELHSEGRHWDKKLYTPPGSVSAQEHHQIEESVEAWAKALASSSFMLPLLPHPLRPMWITPSTTGFPALSYDRDFLPVICVSASKQVPEGTERRSSGFAYIQGSGDDHELWGMGLTPNLFWKHHDELLNAERTALPSLVASIVASESLSTSAGSSISPTPIAKVGGRLLISKISDLPPHILSSSTPTSPNPTDDTISYVLLLPSSSQTPISELTQNQRILRIPLSSTVKSKSPLVPVLSPATSFIVSHLTADPSSRVCVACETGKDLSVGVVLAVLGGWFDDAGNFVDGATDAEGNKESAKLPQPMATDKQAIRTRLEWIIASRPEANPARTTLKRVNEYLLSKYRA
ncbi:initiator tRNA phosphoribosyl transferase [Crucibulum laeve]|uniref:Initiator tRNA phosphoribosyl transferase n=1 Tax=Crucibulum laeve TaxID=68775 RepID=A0A5C3MI86_9AGAR|nr:initiator tRNA phosphoribosyl transferase [Crucibulum laeve]